MWKTFREREESCIRTFPIVIHSNNDHLKHIHPLKQELCEAIVSGLSKIPSIKKIWIFGSSVNHRCTIYSDLDILIEDDTSEKDFEAIDENTNLYYKTVNTSIKNINKRTKKFDILLLSEINKNTSLNKNIERDRRLIYEQPD